MSLIAWTALALLASLAAGCAAPPSAPVETPAPIAVPRAEPVCAHCAKLQVEVVQLRRLLAERESELSVLREQRVEAVKALEETTRRAAGARARLRSLATRAVAASYIADVEVSMATARLESVDESRRAQLARAQKILDSSNEPFAKGDYDAAIDIASHAAEILATTAQPGAGITCANRAVHFVKATPLRVTIDSNLRDGPSRKAAIRGVLSAGTPVMGRARCGAWLRVEIAEGSSGWVHRSLLRPR
jgi:hypothetical protein